MLLLKLKLQEAVFRDKFILKEKSRRLIWQFTCCKPPCAAFSPTSLPRLKPLYRELEDCVDRDTLAGNEDILPGESALRTSSVAGLVFTALLPVGKACNRVGISGRCLVPWGP